MHSKPITDDYHNRSENVWEIKSLTAQQEVRRQSREHIAIDINVTENHCYCRANRGLRSRWGHTKEWQWPSSLSPIPSLCWLPVQPANDHGRCPFYDSLPYRTWEDLSITCGWSWGSQGTARYTQTIIPCAVAYVSTFEYGAKHQSDKLN